MSSLPPDQPATLGHLIEPMPVGQRLRTVAGLANPRRHWLVIVARILVIASIPIGGAAILWVLIFRSGFGVGLFTASALIALLPVPFLVFWFIWLDRFDPAWWEYRLFAFGWGACVATSLSLVVNVAGARLFPRYDIPEIWVAVWVAPVIEEITKGLAPLLLYLLWRREVIGLADAVMYAGLSATGFALTENILYLGGVYVSGEQLQGPLGAVVGVATLIVVRLGLTGFIHPLFTSMTGLGIGMAARARSAVLRWVYPLIGLLLAMVLHGTWNFTAVMAQRNEDVALLGYLYFILTLPVLFGFVVLAFWVRGAPGRAVRRMLPEYVRAGWLSPPELGMLLTLRRRLWARRWAREVAGQQGDKAMRAFQTACTRLALLRDGRLRGIRDWEPGDPERQLLHQISGCRQLFTGRDPAMPAAWWDGLRYSVTFPNGEQHQVDARVAFAMPVPMQVPALPWMSWQVPAHQLAAPSGSFPAVPTGGDGTVVGYGYPGFSHPGNPYLGYPPPGYPQPGHIRPPVPGQSGQPAHPGYSPPVVPPDTAPGTAPSPDVTPGQQWREESGT